MAAAMDKPRKREGEDDGKVRLDPFLLPPILKESLSTSNVTLNLKFYGGKALIVSTRGDGSTRTTTLGEFLDLCDAGECGSCPFQNSTLQGWIFKTGNSEQERFLKLMGVHAISLTLEDCSFEGREHFRTIIYQAFPKLQFFKMRRCKVDNDMWYEDEPTEESLVYEEPPYGAHGLNSLDISDCLPHSMMDMLNHFNKLKSLHLEPVDDFGNLLEIIKLIRAQNHTNLPLKKFNVKFEFLLGSSTASSIELLELHEQLNLPLQSLEIVFEDEEDEEDMNLNNENVIRDILQYHASTLTQLEFNGRDEHGLCKLFPFGFHLEKLEKLVIRPKSFSDNLNFFKNTPNLRIMIIEDVSLTPSQSDSLFSNSSQLEIGDWTLPSLTDLHFHLPLSACNLRKLMKWMPNVENLFLEMDDVKFSMICEHWKCLKHVRDLGEKLTDADLIGKENVREAGGDGEPQSGPNITKLKNLTSFETHSSKLTSASVHEGFLKLANLKWISLGESTQLDDEAKAALKRRNVLDFI